MPAIKSHDGVEIYYESHGAGPVALMFLHGWGGSRETWSGVVKHLDPARFRALCPDLRGHGRSDCPARSFAWEDFEADILMILDRERVRSFIPVGFSIGGKLACYLAAHHSAGMPAQVLIAPVGPGTAPVPRESGLAVCREAGDLQTCKSIFRAWFGSSATDEIVTSCCETIAQTPRVVLEMTAEMALWTSLASNIGRIDIPTLVITGDADPVYHAKYQQEEMLTFLTNPFGASLCSGHFIPSESPAQLAGAISAFCLKLTDGF